jgi:hypothetical protein
MGKQFHDKRKNIRGFVCNHINNKNYLLKIIRKLGIISINEKLSINDMCNMLEIELRNRQMSKYNNKIWFEDFKF